MDVEKELLWLKLKWPKNKSFYDLVYERYGHETLKTVRDYWDVSEKFSVRTEI